MSCGVVTTRLPSTEQGTSAMSSYVRRPVRMCPGCQEHMLRLFRLLHQLRPLCSASASCLTPNRALFGRPMYPYHAATFVLCIILYRYRPIDHRVTVARHAVITSASSAVSWLMIFPPVGFGRCSIRSAKELREAMNGLSLCTPSSSQRDRPSFPASTRHQDAPHDRSGD